MSYLPHSLEVLIKSGGPFCFAADRIQKTLPPQKKNQNHQRKWVSMPATFIAVNDNNDRNEDNNNNNQLTNITIINCHFNHIMIIIADLAYLDSRNLFLKEMKTSRTQFFISVISHFTYVLSRMKVLASHLEYICQQKNSNCPWDKTSSCYTNVYRIRLLNLFSRHYKTQLAVIIHQWN